MTRRERIAVRWKRRSIRWRALPLPVAMTHLLKVAYAEPMAASMAREARDDADLRALFMEPFEVTIQ